MLYDFVYKWAEGRELKCMCDLALMNNGSISVNDIFLSASRRESKSTSDDFLTLGQ